MKLGLIAMSGVRAQNSELMELGLTLPGFVERKKVIASFRSSYPRGFNGPIYRYFLYRCA